MNVDNKKAFDSGFGGILQEMTQAMYMGTISRDQLLAACDALGIPLSTERKIP